MIRSSTAKSGIRNPMRDMCIPLSSPIPIEMFLESRGDRQYVLDIVIGSS